MSSMVMKMQHLICFLCLLVLLHTTVAAPIGLCYGRVANNLPQPSDVINLIKSNGISRIRLFNADPEALAPFAGTGIELMIGVPNENLTALAAGDVNYALEWLQTNILAHVQPNQIKYLAVGNEILLKDPFYTPHILPAINNLYQALQILGLTETIKLSSSHAASILSNSYPPSAGAFDQNVESTMTPLLQFLRDTGSVLMVNVYPYFSYINNQQYVSLDNALFRSKSDQVDQNLVYNNLFDETVDAFVYAMERQGFMGIPVVVTETGWPTAGGVAASLENALAYNGNVVRRGLDNVGTPKRPGVGVEAFLFDLFDENEKSGDESEKHFGIFQVDGNKIKKPTNANPEQDWSSRGASYVKDSTNLQDEEHLSASSTVALESVPIETSAVAVEFPVATVPESETEKHPITSTEIEIVDKSVIEEENVKQNKDQNLRSTSASDIVENNDEDDADEWLKEESSGTGGSKGTTIPLDNDDDDDVSFSDLEEDEGDAAS